MVRILAHYTYVTIAVTITQRTDHLELVYECKGAARRCVQDLTSNCSRQLLSTSFSLVSILLDPPTQL